MSWARARGACVHDRAPEAAGLALWEGDSFPGMRSQLGGSGLQARFRPCLGWGQGPNVLGFGRVEVFRAGGIVGGQATK